MLVGNGGLMSRWEGCYVVAREGSADVWAQLDLPPPPPSVPLCARAFSRVPARRWSSADRQLLQAVDIPFSGMIAGRSFCWFSQQSPSAPRPPERLPHCAGARSAGNPRFSMLVPPTEFALAPTTAVFISTTCVPAAVVFCTASPPRCFPPENTAHSREFLQHAPPADVQTSIPSAPEGMGRASCALDAQTSLILEVLSLTRSRCQPQKTFVAPSVQAPAELLQTSFFSPLPKVHSRSIKRQLPQKERCSF
ncbi:hypothetical protein B0J12DRAFT_17757 [Macrophomina phaseolina]|uniref:Uncharacterized protein n=1 Tax=Macrophomina phaseolina TaxID=35725 RepID=A0ABQ8GXM0_9PEZI|nr:hypothetical protein B0J12DRAFT_17757 [Macrophomina phaseolina]